MALLQKRADGQKKKLKFLPTHFYSMISARPYTFGNGLQYVKEQDLLQWDKLFVPINVNEEHWVMVVVDLQSELLEFYDSLPKKFHRGQMKNIAKFFGDLSTLRGKSGMGISDWKKVVREDILVQPDTFNCGVFVLMFAEMISQGRPLVIDSESLNWA